MRRFLLTALLLVAALVLVGFLPACGGGGGGGGSTPSTPPTVATTTSSNREVRITFSTDMDSTFSYRTSGSTGQRWDGSRVFVISFANTSLGTSLQITLNPSGWGQNFRAADGGPALAADTQVSVVLR